MAKKGARTRRCLRAPNLRAPGDAAYAETAKLLRAGGLVAFPAETVYGLDADAANDRAGPLPFAALYIAARKTSEASALISCAARPRGWVSPTASPVAKAAA